MKPIRNLYEQLGVDAYYKRYGMSYENPHFEQIYTLLEQNKDRLNYQSVFDFCCGGGEVSLILRELGYTVAAASDPYTHKLYHKNLEKPCWKWSFKDIIKGKLSGNYSAVICSFALHLCEEKQLYPVVTQLFQHTPQLVILTPHKRPDLSDLAGVELFHEDFALTPKGKKVFLKAYRYIF